MKEYILVLLLIMQVSCKAKIDTELAPIPIKEGWQKIDLSSFELQTPKGYEFEEQKGIDSFVGKISNSEVTFSFDYGWYSDNTPLTLKEVFTNNLYKFEEEILRQSGHKYRRRNSTHEVLNINSIKKLDTEKYLASFDLQGTKMEIVFSPSELGQGKEFDKFEFIISDSHEFYQKIYFPKSISQNSRVGIYTQELKHNKSDSPNKLAFSTTDTTIENFEEILEILKTIRMKN